MPLVLGPGRGTWSRVWQGAFRGDACVSQVPQGQCSVSLGCRADRPARGSAHTPHTSSSPMTA